MTDITFRTLGDASNPPRRRKLDLRRLDLPLFDRTELPVHADRVGRLARDTASAGCGVAVIGVRTLDARRRELTDQLTARVRRVVDAGA